MQRLDLRRVVQDTATLLRNSHEVGERHTIDVTSSPVEVLVEADENQVRQVVWNLATNGLRAMPNGGALTLSASADAAQGGAPVLTVTDQGVGIKAEDVDSIFQPFRGNFGKGSGLGLAIVHRIITDYGGRIDVRSEPGRGTTIRVVFPTVRQSGQVAAAGQPAAAPGPS
jgi:signal transduction histidine kinase